MKHIQKINEWNNNDSAVSKNGKLLTVYHGTDSRFKKFDASYIGKTDEGFYGRGFYFTPDKEEASEYGPIIIETNLIIKKPFYLRTWSTVGSYVELDLRDDLSKLNGMPKDLKTNRNIPNGYYLKRWEHKGLSNEDIVSYSVHPKEELYGTDNEIYGPDVNVLKQVDNKKYGEQAISNFNDMQSNIDYDSGLPNWLLQKLDRWNFTTILEKNGYDGIFVAQEDGDKTPIDDIDEFIVWNPNQIIIIK